MRCVASSTPSTIGMPRSRASEARCEVEPPSSATTPATRGRTWLSAGPALSHILPRVGGVVAELGGSTSHLASLARERCIPMVLGVLDATQHIPDGAQVAVDGVAGVVRWHA